MVAHLKKAIADRVYVLAINNVAVVNNSDFLPVFLLEDLVTIIYYDVRETNKNRIAHFTGQQKLLRLGIYLHPTEIFFANLFAQPMFEGVAKKLCVIDLGNERSAKIKSSLTKIILLQRAVQTKSSSTIFILIVISCYINYSKLL